MAAGDAFSYVGKNHTYKIVDANTSLAPNNKSLFNPQRYTITIDGVALSHSYNDMWAALRAAMRVIRSRDYQG